MILDSSAIVAILSGEPTYPALRQKLKNSTGPIRVGAPTYLETSIVLDARGDPLPSRAFDNFLTLYQVEFVPFTAEHARIAREAYRDFGKGSGHQARLNFGDCMSYAVAKVADDEMLYVGNDFAHTDIIAA